MKKVFSIILCILLIASLAACSKGSTPSTNTTSTNAAVPSVTEEATEAKINNAHLLGEYYGNSYCNTAMNIGISFHNEWLLSSTAELAQFNNMDEEEMLTNFNILMRDIESACILNAIDPTGTSGANIELKNLTLSGNENITGTQYIEVTKEATKASLQESGASNIMITPTSVQIGGRGYAVQTLSYMLGGNSVYQEQILFPLGQYMAILTLTGDTQTILSRTYVLD